MLNFTQQNSSHVQDGVFMTGKDASWILTSAVIIFTMQTGFGLLEAGCVSHRSEANIMIKNALDVVFGGFTYWAVGFAFSFGDDEGSNPFIGVGHFFVQVDENRMGYVYALFLIQLAFATTANTIVSGAMVERTRLVAYNVFSMLMTLIYCLPAHWMWANNGFLKAWGAVDVAGCGPVHMVGGVTGLVATVLIGPRTRAFDNGRQPLPSPVKAILGMFMLWWGWLRFNSGSVFMVSTETQWKWAVRAAVNTIVSSMGGGMTASFISFVQMKCCQRSRYDIGTIINGVLGSLVSVTAICTLSDPWESFIIGCVGSMLSTITEEILFKVKIDDPVGVVPVHAVCGLWGLLSVGLFIHSKDSRVEGQGGVFHDGQFYLLGVQALSAVIIAAWTVLFSLITLKVIDLTIGLRLTTNEEKQGADFIEHGIRHGAAAILAGIPDEVDDFDETLPEVYTPTADNRSDSHSPTCITPERLAQQLLKSFQGQELGVSLSQQLPDRVCLHLRLARQERRQSCREDSGMDSGTEIYI